VLVPLPVIAVPLPELLVVVLVGRVVFVTPPAVSEVLKPLELIIVPPVLSLALPFDWLVELNPCLEDLMPYVVL